MKFRLFILIVPFIFVLLFLAGCGGNNRPENLPALQPCTVKVMMAGVPVEDAIVSFSPEAGQWFGNAITNSAGTAKILTQGKFVGVPQGTYKVLINKSISSNPNWVPQSEGESAPPTIHHINLKFSDTVKTPLSCEVKEGTNHFDFEVTPP
ncbi:MAG: hypothetical protein LBP87_14885 [Planctomycetaceae bacterium]|jgi:hypothetical protein|nr:hypothetical protein [Planctomycetaceae bacterium]